jgi:hypothetical protein
MSIYTTWFCDDVLAAYFDGGVPSDPATCYASLYTAVTDQEAGTGTEASYTGYARQSTSWGAASAGLNGRQIATDALISFGQKTDTGSITAIAVGLHDALTGGNVMAFIMLDGGSPFPCVINATGDSFTAYNHGLVNDDRVRLQYIAGGGTPTGASENTTYWVITAATDTFQLSATQGGGTITVTADGQAMVLPLNPKDIAQDDTPEFASGSLVIALD